MSQSRTGSLILVLSVGLLLLVGCGDDDATPADTPTGNESSGEADAGDEPSGDGSTGASSGGGAGSLMINGEDIELGPGRCLLKEQPSAGGGGSILLTAQSSGTSAAGEDVRIDFTRYSEDSQFAGDDVSVDIGPPGDSVSSRGTAEAGTVAVDGSVVSAESFPMRSEQTETAISFSIDCG